MTNLAATLAPYLECQTLRSGEPDEWHKGERPCTGSNLWNWCDSLYMAPPVLARLGKATGDPRYFEVLDRLYWNAVEQLYDKDEALVYRDARFFPDKQLGPNGKKIFWARGNGWLAIAIPELFALAPPADAALARYLREVFTSQLAALRPLQAADGMFHTLLDDPARRPRRPPPPPSAMASWPACARG